jgi:hypothetical protein
VNDLTNTNVGMVGTLNGLENDNRTIGSTSANYIAISFSELAEEEWNIHILGGVRRPSDSVVESEAQGCVSFFTTLSTMKEIGLDVL